MPVYLVENWTERIRDTILSDGVVQDVSGMTVLAVAYNSSGPYPLAGTSGVENGPGGIVFYDSVPADFPVKTRLKVRWKVTDLSGKVAYYPNSILPEEWIISKA